MKERNWPDCSPYDDTGEAQGVNLNDVVNYPLNDALDLAAYSEPIPQPPDPAQEPTSSNMLEQILGPWNGYHYASAEEKYSVSGMISMNLVAVPPEDPTTPGLHFKASGNSNGYHFEIDGSCKQGESGAIEVNFKRSFINAPPRYHEGIVGHSDCKSFVPYRYLLSLIQLMVH